MSYFGKYYITGPDAQKAVNWIFSNNVDKSPGESKAFFISLKMSGYSLIFVAPGCSPRVCCMGSKPSRIHFWTVKLQAMLNHILKGSLESGLHDCVLLWLPYSPKRGSTAARLRIVKTVAHNIIFVDQGVQYTHVCWTQGVEWKQISLLVWSSLAQGTHINLPSKVNHCTCVIPSCGDVKAKCSRVQIRVYAHTI